MTPEETAIEIIALILKRHSAECVFELDAPKNIFNRLSDGGFITSDGVPVHYGRLDEFKTCFKLSEIYCPHEGIDRLSEFGLTVNKLTR